MFTIIKISTLGFLFLDIKKCVYFNTPYIGTEPIPEKSV